MQESSLDPAAVSPVGAKGLLQFMPATWADERAFFKWGDAVSASDIEPAIVAGAHYMAKLNRIWSKNRTMAERHDLGLASYNGGAGSVIAAQTRCKGVRLWAEISPCLVWVTGRANAAQTIGYVTRIAKLRGMME